MNDKLNEAIEVLKDAKYIGSDEYASDYDREMNEAIDTVVAEVEKPLPTDDEAGTIAVSIASKSKPNLTAQEESFFVAGFIECTKWMRDLIQERR